MRRALLFLVIILSVLACKKESNDKYIKPGKWTSEGEQSQYYDASGKLIFSDNSIESTEWVITDKTIVIRDTYSSEVRSSSYQIYKKNSALRITFKNEGLIGYSECELLTDLLVQDEMILKGESVNPSQVIYFNKGSVKVAAKKTFRRSISRKPDDQQ